MHVQYVANEQGKQVGVLIDLTDYRRLLAARPSDPEILVDLSQDELDALAESKLAPKKQS